MAKPEKTTEQLVQELLRESAHLRKCLERMAKQLPGAPDFTSAYVDDLRIQSLNHALERAISQTKNPNDALRLLMLRALREQETSLSRFNEVMSYIMVNVQGHTLSDDWKQALKNLNP